MNVSVTIISPSFFAIYSTTSRRNSISISHQCHIGMARQLDHTIAHTCHSAYQLLDKATATHVRHRLIKAPPFATGQTEHSFQPFKKCFTDPIPGRSTQQGGASYVTARRRTLTPISNVGLYTKVIRHM